MEVGKLYKTKKYYWMLYPTKDIAAAAPIATTAAAAVVAARYWSKRLNCNVSYLNPNSIFCSLEQDGKFCRILSTEGNIGWIYLPGWCKKDIEEVKAE